MRAAAGSSGGGRRKAPHEGGDGWVPGGARPDERGDAVRTEKTLRRENVGSGNWKGVGMWAWLLHRISGLVILGYLFVHIDVISQGRFGAAGFDEMFETFETPLFVLLDLLLVAAVLYHLWNGIRVLVFDFGKGTHRHKSLYYTMMALGIVTVAIFAYVSFAFII